MITSRGYLEFILKFRGENHDCVYSNILIIEVYGARLQMLQYTLYINTYIKYEQKCNFTVTLVKLLTNLVCMQLSPIFHDYVQPLNPVMFKLYL